MPDIIQKKSLRNCATVDYAFGLTNGKSLRAIPSSTKLTRELNRAILLVLLSPDAIESKWAQAEWTQVLSRKLDYRAINVVLAPVRDCEVPALLATRTYLDLRDDLDAGVERLKQQLGVAVTIDFDLISPHDFEHLIADLSVFKCRIKHAGPAILDTRVHRKTSLNSLSFCCSETELCFWNIGIELPHILEGP